MIDSQKLKKQLTREQIIKIMEFFGADNYEETVSYLIFPTICHNKIGNEKSMKLYYYYNTNLFHCYTDCGDSFDIYTLIKKVFELRGINYGFYETLQTVVNILQLDSDSFSSAQELYEPIGDKFKKKQRNIVLTPYSENVLSTFSTYYAQEWIDEGISTEAMKKFNILYSSTKNKIIIPHYDVHGDLIGIRGRALSEYEIAMGNKYMPVQVEGILYRHPLSFNLYGLNITKEAIEDSRVAIIFEGEKSPLKLESFSSCNNSVATCGSSINKIQIDLLLRTARPREIVIAYDKEYDSAYSEEAKRYFSKLERFADKYKHYCNFSILFDTNNLLDRKDSPIDKGHDVFLSLLQNRIRV